MPSSAPAQDLVVVGAGAAGLFAALTAADEGARVTLVSARPLAETASYWAQGGIAAAIGADDSIEAHLADTLEAGRGLVRRSAAEALCAEAPARFSDLVALGVCFDSDRTGDVALGLEGGHSARRVAHAGGSATGRRILRQLSARVAEHPGIAVVEGRSAAALLTDRDRRRVGGVAFARGGEPIEARAVILSTGGAAAMWSRTTNPPGSFGSGLLLAESVGTELADLEFVQFHPTAVVGIRGREGFLVSEAVRGEGATLHGADGERFVDELAPRDAVARAIHAHLLDTGTRAVGLDMRGTDPGRFPNIVGALREAGHDPMADRIPVAPASHYMMGGIATGLDGRSGAAGLYAVGECACTGLHGANRLASNSLSECFVFGRRAALAALDEPGLDGPAVATDAQISPPTPETRAAMWRGAGLTRDPVGLGDLLSDPHPLARLIARCALHREESRGAHARADHPDRDPALDEHHTVVPAGPGAEPAYARWT